MTLVAARCLSYAVTVGALSSCVFAALGYASLRTDRTAIATAIRDAFATGDLTDSSYLPPAFDLRGVHQFNDCLIMSFLIDDRGTVPERVLSPHWPMPHPGEPLRPCVALREYLETGVWSRPGTFYHQYLHGHRIVAAFLLQSLSVRQARIVILVSSVALLGGLVLGATFVLLSGAKWTASNEGVIKPIGIGLGSLGFLLFYSLPYFGVSLSHGPSDLVLFAFLVVLAVSPTDRFPDRAWYLLACGFGAAVAHFEFLTGGIPLGAALLMGGVAICPRRGDGPSELWRRAVAVMMCFVATVAVCFSSKMAIVALIVSPGAVLGMFEVLAERMSGAAGGWRYELAVLMQFSGIMLFGLRPTARSVLLLSLAMIAGSILTAFGAGRNHMLQTRQILLTMSVGVIAMWFILFREHTIVHALFMVRVLAWVPIAGAIMSALAGVFLVRARAR